jgi:hypothetical protein
MGTIDGNAPRAIGEESRGRRTIGGLAPWGGEVASGAGSASRRRVPPCLVQVPLFHFASIGIIALPSSDLLGGRCGCERRRAAHGKGSFEATAAEGERRRGVGRAR